LYGVETFVHPEYQSRGIGSKLMDARFDMLQHLNLRGIVAGSLIIGYQAVADQLSPEQYVQQVVAGKIFDPNLSKQLRKGFKVKNLIPHYTEDSRTKDYAAAIVWINPDYRPHVIIPFTNAPKSAVQRPSSAASL
jgi:ribosomal protein S18 acetylase RimI-like enzyme